MPAVNHTQRTTLSIRKSAVRNLMFYADTGGGEVVFFLETGSVERPRVFYSALMTEQVYRASWPASIQRRVRERTN